MIGRLVAILLLVCGLMAGGGMYYLQVYGFYDRLPATARLAAQGEGGPLVLAVTGFQGIDSASSPIRYRACFTLTDRPEGLVPYTAPQPLNAPRWFGCFDARAIGQDIAAGRAEAFLLQGNFAYGFDRVMALYPDGRAFAWQQVNACGTAHFDGRTLPPGCPPAPQR